MRGAHSPAVAIVLVAAALACRTPRATVPPSPAQAPTPGAQALDPAWAALAPTPPMGWNSWNFFHCDVSESLLLETADALVASGMRDAGYRTLVVDDCWQTARDAGGALVADPARFPSGMRAVADAVHARGLRFGLYSDAGALTCQKRPGSAGHERDDARQWAGWGVDYVKYDWCNARGLDPRLAYTTMRGALLATGRPIVFSMCEWGESEPWTWARGVAHLWRTTDDILPCRDCTTPDGGLAWPAILDRQAGLERYAGPGGWNDPDMLQVGNEGMTESDDRAHFTLWAVLAAPLMAGNDVRAMPEHVRTVLLNRDVIAVDQDARGQQGHRVRDDGDHEVWARPLDGGAMAVVLFNRGDAPARMEVAWSELGLAADAAPAVRDLWAHRELGRVPGRFAATVAAHDVVAVRVGG